MPDTFGKTAAASAPLKTQRALHVIFIIMLMDIVGLTILVPVAPYIVRQYSGDALMVTLLTVIYAGALFLSAPLIGKIGDRVGRRPVLLACVFGSAVGYFIFGIGGALWVLFLSRLIDGITGGNLSTATAYIVDVSKPEERAKNFTLIGMAFGLGFILGPAVGGALGQISLNAPVFAAGTISLASVALIYFRLPESLPKERRETRPLRLRDANPFGAIGYMMVKPGLGVLLLVFALFNLSLSGVNSIAGVFIVNKFAAPPWQLGLLFVVAGIAIAIVQAALVSRWVPRFGEKRLAMASLAGNAIGGLLLCTAPALWMLYPLAFLSNGITGFAWPTLGALSANRVSEREQGQLAGVNAALAGLMSAIGPLWAGASYDYVAPAAPYWIGAIILAAACLALAGVRVPQRSRRPAGASSPAE